MVWKWAARTISARFLSPATLLRTTRIKDLKVVNVKTQYLQQSWSCDWLTRHIIWAPSLMWGFSPAHRPFGRSLLLQRQLLQGRLVLRQHVSSDYDMSTHMSLESRKVQQLCGISQRMVPEDSTMMAPFMQHAKCETPHTRLGLKSLLALPMPSFSNHQMI